MVVNIWKAVYSTLDKDGDASISLEEISYTLINNNPSINVSFNFGI